MKRHLDLVTFLTHGSKTVIIFTFFGKRNGKRLCLIKVTAPVSTEFLSTYMSFFYRIVLYTPIFKKQYLESSKGKLYLYSYAFERTSNINFLTMPRLMEFAIVVLLLLMLKV